MHHTSIMLQQRRPSMFPKRSLIFAYITTCQDDTYFPTVKELVSSFRKGGPLEKGLSENPARQTVDELAMEKSGHFSNPDKSASGGNIDGKLAKVGTPNPLHLRFAASNKIKDMPIVLDDVESDDAASEVDLSDFRA